jgi:hypothetical protein
MLDMINARPKTVITNRAASHVRHPVPMNAAGTPIPAYHEAFAGLANVVLEDSWVLGLEASLTALTFRLDLVLTPSHASYGPPLPGEARCYRSGTLVVASESALLLRRSSLPPANDAAGGRDYGHIDTFDLADSTNDRVWILAGDWGDASVRDPRISVRLDGTQ